MQSVILAARKILQSLPDRIARLEAVLGALRQIRPDDHIAVAALARYLPLLEKIADRIDEASWDLVHFRDPNGDDSLLDEHFGEELPPVEKQRGF